MSVSTLKAKQFTSSTLVTNKRALFKQLIVFHAGSSDASIQFYDLTAPPVGGEPFYKFEVYGKGYNNLPIVDPGVLFDDGIYVVTTALDLTVTVLYEEV